MDYLSEAQKIFREADESLRALIDKALQTRHYEDVAKLAKLAITLGQLAVDPAPGESPRRPTISNPIAATPRTDTHDKSTVKPAKAKVSTYPKFEIDGGRLVKIGWSKRERSEYQHKASREAALAVYLKLGNAPAGSVFRMEEILPVTLPDDTEVPSYQTYLVLAWLRSIQAVKKRAKDSYEWVGDDATSSTFEVAWKSTPRRTAPNRPKGR